MVRTSKLTQLKNNYNAQIGDLRAQLAESRLAYFAHGERTYFFMLFILLFLVGISLLIAWAAGAFDSVDKAVEDGEAVKTCGDGKVCDTGFTCKDGVCKKNANTGDACDGIQISECQRCEAGKTRNTKLFEGKVKCWGGEWAIIVVSFLFLLAIGVVVYYLKSIRGRMSDTEVYEELQNDPTLLAGSRFENSSTEFFNGGSSPNITYNVPDKRYQESDYYEAINLGREKLKKKKKKGIASVRQERKRRNSMPEGNERGATRQRSGTL